MQFSVNVFLIVGFAVIASGQTSLEIYKNREPAYTNAKPILETDLSEYEIPFYYGDELSQLEYVSKQGNVDSEVNNFIFNLNKEDLPDKKKEELASKARKLGEQGAQIGKQIQQEILKYNSFVMGGLDKKTCGNKVDLSGRFPPLRNQTNIGWCYAFSAADLLSYHEGVTVSASDIAINYNKMFYADHTADFGGVHEGGYPALALRNILKNGYCLEKDFPSEVLDKNSLSSLPYYFLLNKLSDYQSEAQSNKVTSNVYCKFIHDTIVSKIFPGVLYKDFEEIYKKGAQSSLIKQLNEASCEKKRQPFKHRYKIVEKRSSRKNLLETHNDLMRELENNNPISISINFDLLNQPFHGQHNVSNHAVILAGKAWNKSENRCEYLIRNSNRGGEYRWIPASQILAGLGKYTSLKSD
jgi:hypothetical protein